MASATENRGVNLAGLVLRITLVTSPAASTIFLDSSAYGLVKLPTLQNDTGTRGL